MTIRELKRNIAILQEMKPGEFNDDVEVWVSSMDHSSPAKLIIPLSGMHEFTENEKSIIVITDR